MYIGNKFEKSNDKIEAAVFCLFILSINLKFSRKCWSSKNIVIYHSSSQLVEKYLKDSSN